MTPDGLCPRGDEVGEGCMSDDMFMGEVAVATDEPVGDDDGEHVIVGPDGDEVGTSKDGGDEDEVELFRRFA